MHLPLIGYIYVIVKKTVGLLHLQVFFVDFGDFLDMQLPI
jgi:hypothetical protein